MAEEAEQVKVPSLAEQYSLPVKEEKPADVEIPIKSPGQEKPDDANSDEIVQETPEAVPTAESSVPEVESSVPEVESSAVSEESNEISKPEVAVEPEVEEEQEVAEEKPALKIETTPADYRFPTTNQTRHCFTRYVEYHRCVAAKGDDSSDCDKFAKYYRSLCPGEWVDRWNEQRENGTFPGPL